MVKKEYHSKSKVNGKTKYEKVCVYCGKEVIYYHGSKPSICPHCKSPDYIKPNTETHLFLLQKKYLETGDGVHISKMFKVLKEYAASIIKKLLPKDFRYHYEKIDEKAHDAAALLVENYYTNDIGEFKIDSSFAGYLRKKAQQVLWGVKIQKEDKHDSLNRVIDDHTENAKELIELTGKINVSPLYGTTKDHVVDSAQSRDDLSQGLQLLIESILNRIKDQFGQVVAYQVLYGLCIRIEKGNNHDMADFYSLFGTDLKEFIDSSMLLIYRYIKDMEIE